MNATFQKHEGDIDYIGRYRRCLQTEVWRYKRQLSDHLGPPSPHTGAGSLGINDEIGMLCVSQAVIQTKEAQIEDDDELSRYLAKGLILIILFHLVILNIVLQDLYLKPSNIMQRESTGISRTSLEFRLGCLSL